MTLFFLIVSALHLLAVAAVVILVLIGVRIIQGAYRRAVGAPRLNPNPAQLVHITGAVPGSLEAPALIAIYSTAYRPDRPPPRECVAWYDWFSGASGPKTVELRVPTARTADSVEAEVYLDRYLPCGCNWLLREVKVEIIDPASGGKHGSYRIGYGGPYYDVTYILLGTTPSNKIDDLVTFHCQTYPWGVACSSPKVPGPEGVEVMLRPQQAKARFVAIHDPS